MFNLNPDKCKSIRFYKKSSVNPFSYSINNNLLENVYYIKDLGIIIDSNLKFNYHIDAVVSKSSKMLGFLSRSTKDFTNTRSLNILFSSLVRSILDYCSVVWSPYYNLQITRLENIQKRFVKYWCFKSKIIFKTDHYLYFLNYFGLHPLSTRRIYFDICFTQKILSGQSKCNELLEQFSFHVPQYIVRDAAGIYSQNFVWF